MAPFISSPARTFQWNLYSQYKKDKLRINYEPHFYLKKLQPVVLKQTTSSVPTFIPRWVCCLHSGRQAGKTGPELPALSVIQKRKRLQNQPYHQVVVSPTRTYTARNQQEPPGDASRTWRNDEERTRLESQQPEEGTKIIV